MNPQIRISFGPIQTLPFSKFLDLIPSKRKPSSTCQTWQYYARIKILDFNLKQNDGAFNDNASIDITKERCNAFFKPPTLDNFKSDLLSQIKIKKIYRRPLLKLIKTAFFDSACEYGLPKYLVPIDRRMWLIATPKDFEIISNRNGNSTLICPHPNRNILYSVSKINEDAAVGS